MQLTTDESENTRLMLALAILWTLIIASALIWNMVDITSEVYQESRQMARVALHKDIMYRAWSSMHGGVYVPVTDRTPPNPYLSHIPERDIATPSGRQLTLMNPAYMTRQVYEISKDRYDIYARITSIKPLRPQNAPDEWESKALKSFEKGEKEISEIQTMNQRELMRLMVPFYMEESCMKCHSHQGYKIGDIRGGISVAVPLEHLRAIRRQNEWTLIFRYLCLWMFGLGGICLTWLSIRRHSRKRREAEEALQESEDRYRRIVELFPDLISIHQQGIIVFINDAGSKLVGATCPDQVIGKPVTDFVVKTQKDITENRIRKLLEEEGRSPVYEQKILRLDGTECDIEVVGIPFIYKGNSAVQIIARDITDRKRAEEESRKAKEAAEAATRAKSEFLARMSHEIRTPLNAIIGFSRIIFNKEVGELNQIQTEYLGNVLKSSEHLLTLISDILDFSKIEAGKLELEILDFNLQDIVGEVINLMRFKAEEKSIRLTSHIDSDLPSFLRGDPTRLRQVLLNLVNNAIKFTEKGSIGITVQSSKLTVQNDYSSLCTLHFEISDTGIGISKEHQDRLFQAFSQTDASVTRRFGGTGLGLAIAKAIVEKMNGQIGVESEEGKGSKFWFTAAFEKSVNVLSVMKEKSLNTFHLTRHTSARILLVEDNELNRKLALHLLNKLGFQADSVNNGKEAIRAMQTTAYDIVLMDIQMPEMDGIEATKIIRQAEANAQRNNSSVPIIAMTAHAMQSDRDRCIEAGMNDYISKPISSDRLLKAIWNQLSRFPKQKENSQLEENMSEKTVFDKTEMMKLVGYDEALCKEMIDAFMQYFPGMVAELKSALDKNDANVARVNAHSLKGSCRQMAAHRLSDIFAEMEILAKNGESDKVRSLIGKAEEEYEKLREVLRAMC